MLPAVRFLEQRTKFHQGGKSAAKTKSVIKVKEDVADDDIQRALATKECETPHIVAFLTGGELSGIYIVGDTVHIEINKAGDVMDALLKLIATYYVFDLDYPKEYAMMLAILQVFITDEPYKQTVTKGFKMVAKDLRAKLSELKETDQEENSNTGGHLDGM
ncbi:PREDICTED: uncharacterized protein LOC106807031 [Priapulus caudatus]|uniref:Uncharacterized protein LOC106807031 n=1 Tax=Priapulus caudatus TaxID=37621 RepID=A0ABM1DXP9_PRICU|nr:PREDICTED: uncharacterized protein LOC106807031 [Priapulus caudatus]